MRDMRGLTVPVSLIFFELRLGAWPWQFTSAWALLIGSLMTISFPLEQFPWLSVLLTLLLVDVFWGAWWRLATRLPDASDVSFVSLPYATPAGPWVRFYRVVPPGFVTGVFFTVGLGVALAAYLGGAALWATSLALGLSLVAWWVIRVWPAQAETLAVVYGIALPFWAGAYILGGDGMQAGVLAAALAALRWALYAERWRRGLWTLLGIGMWIGALWSQMPPWFLGLSSGAFLITLTGPRSSSRVDAVWLGILLGGVLLRHVS